MFRGARVDPEEGGRIVRGCWPLPEIDARYAAFLARYKPALRRLQNGHAPHRTLTPDECFAWRFWATYDYSEFPRIDPLLPDALLPRRWRGNQAYALLTELRRLTYEPAREYLRRTGLLAPASPNGAAAKKTREPAAGTAALPFRRQGIREPAHGR
jgi:DNA-binding transcriptional regulator PaaX